MRILAIGQAVEQFVLQNSDTLSALGVSKQKQQQLGILKKQFEQAIKLATNTAGDRRNLNREIRQLIKECNHMLRWELDIYLKFNAANFPVLYAQYDYLRKPKRRQKPKETAIPAHQDSAKAPLQTKALPEKDRLSPAILLSDTNLLTKAADSTQKQPNQTDECFKPPREQMPDLFSWQNLN